MVTACQIVFNIGHNHPINLEANIVQHDSLLERLLIDSSGVIFVFHLTDIQAIKMFSVLYINILVPQLLDGNLTGQRGAHTRFPSSVPASTQPFILNSFVIWTLKAGKQHPSQFLYVVNRQEGNERERGSEGRRQRKRAAMVWVRALQQAEDNAELAESVPCARGNTVPHGAPYELGQPGGGCGPQRMYECVLVYAFVLCTWASCMHHDPHMSKRCGDKKIYLPVFV